MVNAVTNQSEIMYILYTYVWKFEQVQEEVKRIAQYSSPVEAKDRSNFSLSAIQPL